MKLCKKRIGKLFKKSAACVIVCLIILSLFLAAVNVKPVLASDWSDWAYYKDFQITGSTGENNYPIFIRVHYGSGTDNTTNVNGYYDVYLNGHCRTDFGDLRFVQNGVVLDYWFKNKVNSDYALAIVEIASIPASPSTTTVYMYYNNPSATYVGNSTNTLYVGESFDGSADYERSWIVESGTWAITANGHTAQGYRESSTADAFSTVSQIFQRPLKAEFYVYWESASAPSSPRIHLVCDTDNFLAIALYTWIPQLSLYKIENGIATEFTSNPPMAAGNWYKITLTEDASGNVAVKFNDAYTITASTVLNNFTSLKLRSWQNIITRFDDVIVRKWVDSEPTITMWGTEKPVDSSPPTYTSIGFSNSVAGETTVFSCLAMDNTNLASFIFSYYNGVTWTNDTANSISGTSVWCNTTKTLPSTINIQIQAKWYIQDIAGNWNTTTTIQFYTDSGALGYGILGHAGSTGGETANFYLYANDIVPLDTFIFSYKTGSGSYTNLTAVHFSSTPGWGNISLTLPTQNVTFYFKYYFNNSNNNWNITVEQSFAVTYIYQPHPPPASPTPSPSVPPTPTATPIIKVGETKNLYFRADTYTTRNITAYALDVDYTNTLVTSNTQTSVDQVQYGIRVYLVSNEIQRKELTSTYSAIIILTSNSTGNYTGVKHGYWTISTSQVILGYQALQVEVYSYTPTSMWVLEKTFISPILITKEIISSTIDFTLYVNVTFYDSTNGHVSNVVSNFSFGDPAHKSGLFGLQLAIPKQSDVQLWRLNSGDYVGFEIGAYVDVIGEAFYVLILVLIGGILYFRYGHFGVIIFAFVLSGVGGSLMWIFIPPWAAAVASALLIIGSTFIVWRVIR